MVKKITEKNFNDEVIKSDQTVLLDFYAEWCGPCNTLSPIIDEIANENKNIKSIEEIDLNNVSISTKTFYRTKELVKENL